MAVLNPVGTLGRHTDDGAVNYNAVGTLGRHSDAVSGVHATLNGHDVTDKIDWETFKKSESLGEFQRRATCTFTLNDPGFKPLGGQEVAIYLPTTSALFFAGRITDAPEIDVGYNEHQYQVSCVDFTADLDRRLVITTFDSTTTPVKPTDYNLAPYSSTYNLYTMVRWLIDKQANKDQYGATIDTFTYASVDIGGPNPLPPIQFNHVPVSEAISQLCQLAGFKWYVDYDRSVHAFPENEGTSPWTITEAMTEFEDLSISWDVSQVRNRVIVQGGKQVTERFEYYTAVVSQTIFPFSYPILTVSDFTAVTVGGVGQTIGVDTPGATGSNCYVNPDSGLVRFAVAPGAGAVVISQYNSQDPIRVFAEDATAITYLASISGGSGIREYILTDETLMTTFAADLRAKAEIAAYAYPRLQGTVTCHRAGIEVGQVIPLTFAARAADGTVQRTNAAGAPLVILNALVQQVDFEMVPTDTANEAEYYGVWRVTFGAQLLGFQQILGQLLLENRRRNPSQVEVLEHLLAPSESMVLSETISPTTRSKIYTWAPAGGSGQWDFAEWG